MNDIKHSLMDKLQQRKDDKSFSHKYDSYLKAHLGKAEQTAMSFSVVCFSSQIPKFTSLLQTKIFQPDSDSSQIKRKNF